MTAYRGKCSDCGEPDEDLVRCVGCGALLCYECIRWCNNTEDAAWGDWYCLDCITGDEG